MAFSPQLVEGLVQTDGSYLPADSLQANQGPVLDQAWLEAQIATGGNTIILPDYATINLDGFVIIYEGTEIRGNPNARATMVWHGYGSYAFMLVPFGNDITLSNFNIDWNSGPQWHEYYSVITPSWPNYAGNPDPNGASPETSRLTIDGLIIYDSDPPLNRNVNYALPTDPGTYGGRYPLNTSTNPIIGGDNWSIQAVNLWGVDKYESWVIRNCVHLRENTQFTANGYGRGLDGIHVDNNYTNGGQAAGIAFTNSGTEAGDGLNNISITNNTVVNAGSYAIYVGPDGPDTGQLTDVLNLKVANNYIETGRGFPTETLHYGYGVFEETYGTGLYVRAYNTGSLSGLQIYDNTFNGETTAAAKTIDGMSLAPRGIVYSCNVESDIYVDNNYNTNNAYVTLLGVPPVINSCRRDQIWKNKGLDAYTINDTVMLRQVTEINQQTTESEGIIFKDGKDLTLGGSASEINATPGFNDTARNYSLRTRYFTIHMEGHNNTITEITFTFLPVDYPSVGQWIYLASLVQKTVNFAMQDGTIYWADGSPPDFLGTIPAQARVLIDWRFDGTDMYASFEVMS